MQICTDPSPPLGHLLVGIGLASLSGMMNGGPATLASASSSSGKGSFNVS